MSRLATPGCGRPLPSARTPLGLFGALAAAVAVSCLAPIASQQLDEERDFVQQRGGTAGVAPVEPEAGSGGCADGALGFRADCGFGIVNQCGAEVDACECEPDCLSLVRCLERCSWRTSMVVSLEARLLSCAQGCLSDHPAGGRLVAAVDRCMLADAPACPYNAPGAAFGNVAHDIPGWSFPAGGTAGAAAEGGAAGVGASGGAGGSGTGGVGPTLSWNGLGLGAPDLAAYCASCCAAGVAYDESAQTPAYGWSCDGQGMDLNTACAQTFPGSSVACEDLSDANCWYCAASSG